MFQPVINYFQTLEQHPVQRLAFLVGGLLLFWIIEGTFRLFNLLTKRINYNMQPSTSGLPLFILLFILS